MQFLFLNSPWRNAEEFPVYFPHALFILSPLTRTFPLLTNLVVLSIREHIFGKLIFCKCIILGRILHVQVSGVAKKMQVKNIKTKNTHEQNTHAGNIIAETELHHQLVAPAFPDLNHILLTWLRIRPLVINRFCE